MYPCGGESNEHAAFTSAWQDALDDSESSMSLPMEMRQLSRRELLERCLFMDKGDGIEISCQKED